MAGFKSVELAKKVTDFMVSLQPQATVDTGNPDVNLLQKQIELLQQQLTGFQQPFPGAQATCPAETIATAGTPPPSQPVVSRPTVHEPCYEPSISDHAAIVKGPDGSTKLQNQGPQDAKHPCFMRSRKRYLPQKRFLKSRSHLRAEIRRARPTKMVILRTLRQPWSTEQLVMLRPF